MYNILILLLISLLINGCKKHPTEPSPPDSNKDFTWSVDSIQYNNTGLPQPGQVLINCLWGSSYKDVFAVGHSDVGGDEVYHYDGKKWTLAYLTKYKWPIEGNDNLGHYYIRPMAVTGFDSTDVLLACSREYWDIDTAVAMILRWNGSTWSEVPFSDGIRTPGGIGWIVRDIFHRAWAVTAGGCVVRYENGMCSTEPKFIDNRLVGPIIVASDNGKVYVNVFIDSLKDNQSQGKIINFFERDNNGKWSLLEHKIILGSNYDDNGLGLGLIGIGNRIFTDNAGIWEKVNDSWIKLSPAEYSYLGGYCLTNENDMWFYFNYNLYHYNNNKWGKQNLSILNVIPGGYLYGQGWSDGKEVFIPAIYQSKTYILHGKK